MLADAAGGRSAVIRSDAFMVSSAGEETLRAGALVILRVVEAEFREKVRPLTIAETP